MLSALCNSLQFCVLFVYQTGISFEERGYGTLSLAPPDSTSTSTPYCPTNVKVLEAMAKFQNNSAEQHIQQVNTQSVSGDGVDHPNSATTSRGEQAVLISEENTDLAIIADVAMADRSPTRSSTDEEQVKIQQLRGDDREGERAVNEKATNAVDNAQQDAREVVYCSSMTDSLTASTAVSLHEVETQQLTPEAAGGWRRPRGRGRGRGRPSPFGSGVADTVVGTPSTVHVGTSRMEGERIGRGRARSIIRQSYVGSGDSSTEWMSGCLERQRGAEANESGGASTFPPCEYLESERSVAVSVAEAIVGDELCGMSRINYSADPECGSDVSHIGEFSDGRFPLTSTPTGSQAVSNNESHFLDELLARPAAAADRQLHNRSLPPAVGAQACQGCKQLTSIVAAMESKITKLSKAVAELHQRLDKQKISRPKSDEIFADKRLMRVKAAAFVTGRPLSAHACKQLVLNIYDNEPPYSFNSDDIKSINDNRECRDAQSLSKWAVFEMFSLQELVGRNCLGGGHDILADGNAEIKKPFDEVKMHIIKTAVFKLYPQQNDSMQKAVWTKCVEKINSDVRYLFKVSLKKHEWLHLGF